MVYSHYWSYNAITNIENRKRVCEDFLKLLNHLNIHIFLDRFDDKGLYKPEVNTNMIYFNKTDYYTNCNPFKIEFNVPEIFDFCVTNKNPDYDLVVSLAILCLANNIPEFSCSSDGNYKEWKKAFDTYESILNKPLKVLPIGLNNVF